MSWTKRQLIEEGYSELGLRPGVFSITAEMMETGLNRLDSMMAFLNSAKGIRVGYPLPGTPEDSDPDQDSNLPDVAFQPVVAALAVRIAPTIGKTPSDQTKIAAHTGIIMLTSWCASQNIPSMQPTKTTPRGAGNKPYRRGVGGEYYRPADKLDVGADGSLDVGDYSSGLNA